MNNNPSIYEIGGLDNAIIGPKGRVCGIPLPSKSTKYGTKMNQYDGYILLNPVTTMSATATCPYMFDIPLFSPDRESTPVGAGNGKL